ncbi:hypothetical protein BOX15_Mlig019492g1, partial [Macrostomum lignano]
QNMYLEVFKEPRGMMRLIQLLFAILAFSTTAGYNSTMKFEYRCKTGNDTGSRQLTVSYPFYTPDSAVESIVCPSTGVSTVQPGLNYPFGSYMSSAQFYVFVGVMAFLYCIGITVLYVVFEQVYNDNDLVPQIDFIVTAVWTLFWFIASVAWAVGVSFFKLETYPDRLWHQITACLGLAECKTKEYFGYGGLDVSLICGFANVFLWGASLWFLFKETVWFKRMYPEQAYGESDFAGGGPDPSGGSGGYQQKGGVETGAGLPPQ